MVFQQTPRAVIAKAPVTVACPPLLAVYIPMFETAVVVITGGRLVRGASVTVMFLNSSRLMLVVFPDMMLLGQIPSESVL